MSATRRRPPVARSPPSLFYFLCPIAVFVSIVNAAITCQSAADAALATLRPSDVGLIWPCCSRTNASCIMVQNDCPKATYPEFANCITASGSAVCGLNADSQDTGAPCASYTGTLPPYGVWPVDSTSTLQFDLLGTMTVNWPKIIADDGLVTCCRDGNGSCHLANLEDDDINPCDQGEYELFCVGDAKHGMCTVRANTRNTHQIGQYFRVNLDNSQTVLPQSQSSTSTPSGPTSTPNPQSDASAQSLRSAPGSTSNPSSNSISFGGFPGSSATSDGAFATASQSIASTPSGSGGSHRILAIVLPVVLILLLVLATIFGVLWRRRKAARAVQEFIDPLPNVVQLPISTNSIYPSTESNTPTSYERVSRKMYASGVTGGTSRETEVEYSDWPSLAPPAYSHLGD